LRPGPWQPRRQFDPAALADLAESLKIQGVLTPLRVVPSDEENAYLIIAGERRWRASELAGISELPCLILDGETTEEALRGLAILDNLHRANLRPGEEARAIADLEQLGMSVREIARGLGKSEIWVNQRLGIARLPDPVIEGLDWGTITIEEARALTKLIGFPQLLAACLEPDGKLLKDYLGLHVPESLGERVQAARRYLESERQREAWVAKLCASGQRVLDEKPREGDRRYVRLLQGSDLSRFHQEAGLSCEVWSWENGRPVRYCDNPALLHRVADRPRQVGRGESRERAEVAEAIERESARDALIGAWLATSRNLDTWELSLLARERIQTLTASDDRLLTRLGGWLGAEGDRVARASVAKQELDGAGERRLLQLWFLIEVAHSVSFSVIPTWLEPWLDRLGFVDPRAGGTEVISPRGSNGAATKVEGNGR